MNRNQIYKNYSRNVAYDSKERLILGMDLEEREPRYVEKVAGRGKF